MKTIIIGKRSFLSKNLKKKIPNSDIYSLNDFITLNKNNKIKGNFNIIINSFYPSANISKITSYEEFTKLSSLELARLLDNLSKRKLKKILYTSSASVYGSLNSDDEIDYFNRTLYASSKILCENLIKNYCQKNKIKYTICRVFNLYGDGEIFSVISRIIKNHSLKKQIIINNKGTSVRDYIHVNDVCKIYQKILSNKFVGTLDVGTGVGIKISDIINYIEKKNLKLKYTSNDITEIQQSIANNDIIKNTFKFTKFFKLENFLKRKIQSIKKNKIELSINLRKNNLFKNIEGTVIYGCGFSGIKIAKELLSKNPLNVFCFIDDDKDKIGKIRLNKPIYSFKQLEEISKNFVIPHSILAIPSLNQSKQNEAIKKLYKISLNVSALPVKNNLDKENISIDDLNDIDINDILNRKVFNIDRNKFKIFKDKKILITGAGGSIGSEICKQLFKFNVKKIIALDISEYSLYTLMNNFSNNKKDRIIPIIANINDKILIRDLEKKNNFDYVFHAAAYKHVNLLEKNVLKAVENNIFGTINLLDCFKYKKTNIVIISTDKAAKPKNVLGFSKRIAEIASIDKLKEEGFAKIKLSIVRFGNVWASQGSAIPLFVEQIRSNKPITITNLKAKSYFMTISEACNLVIQSCQLKAKNKIFILKMGNQIKILDIIKKLIIFFNKDLNNYRIQEIGLNKGEKLEEVLSYSKKSSKTKNLSIYSIEEPHYKYTEIKKLLENLEIEMMKIKPDQLYIAMKKFLNKEV